MNAFIGRRLAVLAAAFGVLACGGIAPTPPTHIVALPPNVFGEFVLLIYDETGLVLAAAPSARERLGQAPTDPGAVAHPDSNEVDFSWTGGACAHGPKLAVSGDASGLTLELDAAPFEFSAVPVSCPAVGLLFAVTLTLSAPVDQDALSVKLLSR